MCRRIINLMFLDRNITHKVVLRIKKTIMKTDLIEVVSKYIVVGMFIGFLALCIRYSILLDKALQ